MADRRPSGDDGGRSGAAGRFAGILLLAAWLPAAAPALPAAAEADPRAQVRAALYHTLMAEIMKTGVESASDGARWSIGEVNPYPALTGDKVISACINWDNTTLGAVDWYGYAYYYDRSGDRPTGEAARLERLEERAQAFCRRYEATSDCWCQPVDRNGRNALAVPEWFLRSRLERR